MNDVAHRLHHVLAGQRFPADRWELISAAESYGADTSTRFELQSLPARRFGSLADVLMAVQRERHRRIAAA